MDAVARTYVIEAVFVVESESEEDAVEIIERRMINCNDNTLIIDGMVYGTSPSASTECSFMTSKKRRMFFQKD